MAKNLKVDELRDALSKRGLSTTGIKPTLVRRLETALQKEANQSKDGIDGVSADAGDNVNVEVGKKRERERDDDNVDNDESVKKMSAVEKIRVMTVKELREQATLMGVSSVGTKKQLIERLCADAPVADNTEALKDDKEMDVIKKEEPIKEKLVTATKKGSAVLDQWLPDHIKNQYHVLQLGDDIYDAMLNQTNVGDNNNKFYVMQVLEMDGGGTYYVYNRWGRVGIKGQDKLFGPYTSRESAIEEFVNKFWAKTKNCWANRDEFISHPKSYTWLEMDYTENEKDTVQSKPSSLTSLAPRESKLELPVANLISLICNVAMMKQQMMEIGYNAEKLPLGKLSKSTISKGYDVLKRISEVVGQANRKELEQLSGEFYTVIPHDFGFKKMREFVIDTPQKLKSKLEMVEALGEIELATKLLKEDTETEDDPLYSQYQRLNCGLTSLNTDSEEFSMVVKYLKNTHGETHSNYSVDVVHVFRVSRGEDNERFNKFSSTKNRMLLWHGSRLTNWAGILSQGLRIAPPEAPVTGYMFGKGVYFADMFSKSANYCYANHSSRSGVLLLCEVALGDMEELLYSNYNADQLPKGKLSTKGVGRTAPDASEGEVMKDGVIVPNGKAKEQKGRQGSLLYNEYIVYNVDQIRMRYLLQVNFNFKSNLNPIVGEIMACNVSNVKH
ncbi:uncharacterized protein [Phyllobates terribilis]|uniref:uncharacterized protein n=1 Tax=Phyllobates terribilis TaxID=111132 RepID=UPI003CCA9205